MMNRIERVKQVYARINANDIEALMDCFHPEAVCVEPEGFPTAGIYRGRSELEPHFKAARNTWAEGTCSPLRFQENGNRVIAFVHVHVRLKEKTEWIDAHIADVFTFQDDQVVEMRIFATDEDALKWVRAHSI